MKLSPSEDVKINKYNLDEEAAGISTLINEYDTQWNTAVKRLESLTARIENISDELKNLRMTLSFEAKSNWKNYPELNEGKSPSDKLCESWAFTKEEYKEKFEELKKLRIERVEAFAEERLLCNQHFIMLNKAKNIEVLTRQWIAQYFSTDRAGGSQETKEENNKSQEATSTTKQINRTLKRREK